MVHIRHNHKIKIVRIISFYDEGIKASGTICYTHPLSSNMAKLNNILIKWLSELKLRNVRLIQSTIIDTTDKSTIDESIRTYIVGRQSSKLSLTCLPLSDKASIIKTVAIKLCVYWNKNDITLPPMLGGTIYMDNDVNILNSIRKLSNH